MILRSMTIQECWCPNCGRGQMDYIQDILFKEGISENKLIGRKLICERCGAENEIEDVLLIIPTSFLVSSSNDLTKIKSNEDIFNWLNKEDI